MQRMYSDFYDSPIDTSLGSQQQQTAHANAHAANESAYSLGHSLDQMSIDEHLRSLPTPPPWMPGGQDQFRHPQESDMLRIGQPKVHLPHQQTSSASASGSCHQPPAHISRCDARVPSSSDTSSSSCSPSSSENIHAGMQNDPTSTTIANHAMKPEPIDDYLPVMHQMSDNLGLGFGSRCGSSNDSHPSSTQRRSRSSMEGMLKCSYCPKKFGTQAVLESHMRDCQLIRLHECSHCQKRFKARGGLQQHMRIHNNDRPYACHFCTKRFTQKSHVDQHERIHTGAKPFSCQYCGRAFRQRSQQLGHEATHVHAAQENRTVELPKLSLSSDEVLHHHQQQQQQQQAQQQRLPATTGANPAAVSGLLALSQQQQQQQQQQQNHLLGPPTSMLALSQTHPSMMGMSDFHQSLMLNQMM